MSFITTNYKTIKSMQHGSVRDQTKQENIADHKSFKQIILDEKINYSIMPNFLFKFITKKIINVRQAMIIVYLMNNTKYLTISAISNKLNTDIRIIKKDLERLIALKMIRVGMTNKTNAGVQFTMNDLEYFYKLQVLELIEIKEIIKKNAVNLTNILKNNQTKKQNNPFNNGATILTKKEV